MLSASRQEEAPLDTSNQQQCAAHGNMICWKYVCSEGGRRGLMVVGLHDRMFLPPEVKCQLKIGR